MLKARSILGKERRGHGSLGTETALGQVSKTDEKAVEERGLVGVSGRIATGSSEASEYVHAQEICCLLFAKEMVFFKQKCLDLTSAR